jgi:hypothetical protein
MKPRSAYSAVRDGSPLKAPLAMEMIGLESIRLLNEMWDKGESTSKESCIIQYVETVEADKSPIIQGRDHIRVQNSSNKRMYHMLLLNVHARTHNDVSFPSPTKELGSMSEIRLSRRFLTNHSDHNPI